MDKVKSMLRISGIINCIIGVIAIKIPVFSWLLIILGCILYLTSTIEDEKLIENKNILLIFGILTVPLNFITSILVILSHEEINKHVRINGKNAPPKVIYKTRKKKKKIDLLLKLGVGMILLSGILFATTSWSFINDIYKAIFLVIFGILFMILSIFTEDKLKLYKSSYTYWILSISFFIITIIGFLYFGIFGTYLTYEGIGSNLAYFITYFFVSLMVLTTYLKYPKKHLLFIVYTSLLLAIYNILVFLNLTALDVITIITIITIFINLFIKKTTTLHNFSRLLSLILFILIIMNFEDASTLSIIISSITNIINLNILIYKKNNKEDIFISMIITYILIYICLSPIEILEDYIPAFIFLGTTLYFLLINSKTITNIIKNTNYIIYTISSLFLFIVTATTIPIISIVISLIYLLMNTCLKYEIISKDNKLSYYMEPLTIITLLSSIEIYIMDTYSFYMILAISSIIYCILNMLYKNTKSRRIYYSSTMPR